MKLDKYLKFFFPPFLYSQIKVLYSIVKYRKYLNKTTIKNIKPNNKVLCVLGNGPSLSKSIEKYEQFMKNNDCLVVNFFANTDLYEKIKPNFYLFMDPAMYLPFDKMGKWKDSIEKLVDNFINKTSWDINIILPVQASDSEFVQRLETGNNFIHIYYLNTISKRCSFSQKSKFKNFDKNFIAPPSQTVMNTAVYLGIFFNYLETYVFGIDSTFFDNLDVDQETNILYANDSHFYGSNRFPWYIGGDITKIGKVHEITGCFVKMFELYWEVRNYADYKGLNVYNASEFSMVDAFERKKPELKNV